MGVLPSMDGKMSLPGGAVIRNTFIELQDGDSGPNMWKVDRTLRRQHSDSALDRPGLRSEIVADIMEEEEDDSDETEDDDTISVVSVESAVQVPSPSQMSIPSQLTEQSFQAAHAHSTISESAAMVNFDHDMTDKFARRVSFEQTDPMPRFTSRGHGDSDEDFPIPAYASEQSNPAFTSETTMMSDETDVSNCSARLFSKPVDEAMVNAREVFARGGGLSGNTTLMARNIPSKYTQSNLMREIDASGFRGTYDFFYLPIHPQCPSRSRGFVFINFCTPEAAELFYKVFHGHKLKSFQSQRVVSVRIADMQGFEANAEHYLTLRNSGRCSAQNGTALFFRPFPPHLQEAATIAEQNDEAASNKDKGMMSQQQPENTVRRHDGGSVGSVASLRQAPMSNQRLPPPPQQLGGPGPSQLPATSPLELAAAAASSGYVQKFGGNDGLGGIGGYQVPSRWPQGMGPPPANLGMQDLSPGGFGLGQDNIGSRSAARSMASAAASEHMDPIAALAALLAAPKNQPQVEAVGVAARPGGLQTSLTGGFQSPAISPPASNFSSLHNFSGGSLPQGPNMNSLNPATLESSLQRAVMQAASVGHQMPMVLPTPTSIPGVPGGLGPNGPMGVDMPVQSNDDDDIQRFCVYCGKRRAPDHLFCAFCGRRSSGQS